MTPNVGDRVWRTEDGKVTFDGYVHTRGEGGFLVYCCAKDALPLNRSSLYGTIDSPDPLVVVNTLYLMLSLDGWSWVPYEREEHPDLPETTEAQRENRARLNALGYAKSNGWLPGWGRDGDGFRRVQGTIIAEASANGVWTIGRYTSRQDGGYSIERNVFADAPGGTAPTALDAMIAADAWLESR